MSIIGTIYEDVTTEVLGDIGSWQWLVTLMATILMTSSFFNQYEDSFFLHPSKVICNPSDEYDNIVSQDLCTFKVANSSEDINCEKWHVKILWMLWINKTWLIFCDDKIKLLLTAIICRLAMIFGYVIFGLVADSFGRKTAIAIDIFASLALRIVITFCDSEAWFRLALFLEYLFGCANFFVGLVTVCEIASNKWRSWLSVIAMSPRLLAAVCTVPLANAIPNAETYNMIAWVLGIGYIFILKWMPESPQWMLFNRKIHVAERLLCKAALQNDITFSADFKIRPLNNRAYNCLDEPVTCFRIVTVHNIRVIVAVSFLFWGLFYFLWGSLYLRILNNGVGNYMVMQIIVYLGLLGLITTILSKKLTLQQFLLIHIMLTGIFMAGVSLFEQQVMGEIFASMTLASALMVHALILNITPRFYAINVRATLFGCCHSIGQFGAMLSYILFIYKSLDDLLYIILDMGIVLILMILSFTLPIVDNRELPDVIEDMDYFAELSKPLRWATQTRTSASKEEVEMRVHSFGSAPASNSFDPQETAQPLGLKRLWHTLMKYIQRKFRTRNHC